MLSERGFQLTRQGEAMLATLPETDKGFKAGSSIER